MNSIRPHTKLLALPAFDKIISKHISKIFDKEIEKAKKINRHIDEDLQYLKELSTVKGKKLRAYLIYIGSHMYGRTQTTIQPGVLQLAAAMEVFHTAVLIHDDIEDQSELRRGMPSYHMFEAKRFKSAHIGESLAINFGSTGLFLSTNIIANIQDASPKIRTKLINLFTRSAIVLSYGQAYDISSDIRTNPDLTFKEILSLCNLKTGVYTFLLPLQLGAEFRGHDLEVSMQEFAYNAGLVFQLTDDYLDIFADEETSGKDSCNDLKEGKINSIIFLTLKHAKKKDQAYILRILKGKETDLDVAHIRDIITTSGASAELERQIDKYAKRALAKLQEAHIAKETKEILADIVESLKHRLR